MISRRSLVIGLWSIVISVTLSHADTIPTPFKWKTERSRPAKFDIPIKRGETIYIMPAFSDYGVPTDLSQATDIGLFYRQTGDPNLYYLPGTTTANTGELYFVWTPAAELTNTTYAYEILTAGLTNTAIRQEGTITMLPNLGYEAPATNPTPIRLIDCASVLWLNAGMAPTNLIKFIQGPQGPKGDKGDPGTPTTNITIQIITNLNQTVMTMTVTNITIGGGGGAGNYTNTEVNGIAHTNGIRIGDSVNSTWTLGTDGVWRVDMSTNQLQWVVNGEHIGGVGSNGITLLKGTLQLYEEDLDCNVRLYDGSRLVPSLTFKGHPGEWGMYARGYGGHYVAGWSVASNEVGLLHAGGVRLMDTNAAFEGRLIGDISGATGYPEPLFEGWRTNMQFSYLSISNLTIANGLIQTKDINGTERARVDSAGAVTLRNAAGMIRTLISDGILYIRDSLGRTTAQLDTRLHIYEPVSGQKTMDVGGSTGEELSMWTPSGYQVASLSGSAGLVLSDLGSYMQRVWLRPEYFRLMNVSSQLVFQIDGTTGKTQTWGINVTNSEAITFYGPNGTNLLTLKGLSGNVESKGALLMTDSGGTNWLTASNRTLNVTGTLRMNGVQGPTGFYTNLTIGSKTQVWMMASGIITNIITL